MRVFLLIFICIDFVNVSVAQSNLTSTSAAIAEKTPSSPTVAGLSKYLEYPVNMSSGIPSIQIPIYTISEGNIQVPISLSFFAGGIKVNELPSPYGMGWTLNAGGAVIKKVNGLDDYFPGTINQDTYLNPSYGGFHPTFQNIEDATDRIRGVVNTPPYSAFDYALLERFVGRIIQSQVDGEADEYLFSTPEGGGKIYFSQRENQWKINKRNGWKAEGYNLSNMSQNNFVVHGTKGLKYDFGVVEMMANPQIMPAVFTSGSYPTPYYLPSSWHLSSILDEVNNREVTFQYNKPVKSTQFDDYTATFNVNGNFEGLGVVSPMRLGEEVILDKIFFGGGRVEFIPTTTPGSLIKEIKIYNQNRLCKMYKLSYVYKTPLGVNGIPDPNAQIPFLDTFEEVDISTTGNISNIPPYKFTYDFSSPMPKRDSYAQDIWGFYNGKLSNPNTIPKSIVQAFNPSWAATAAGDREIDVNYCNVGNIKEITYPTGGKSNFEFEINQEDGGLIGGLRLKNLTTYDPVSNSNILTSYDYKDDNGIESGVMLQRPRLQYEMMQADNTGNGINVVKILGNSIYPMFPNNGGPVYYQQVTQKLVSSTQNLISKHYFTIPANGGYLGNNDGVPFNKTWIDESSGGLEGKSEVFKTLPNNTYEKISQEETYYLPLNNYNEKIWNIQAAWAKYGQWTTWVGNDPYSWNYPQMNMEVSKNLYPLIRESIVPVERNKEIYSNGVVLNDHTTYTYDNNNGLIKSEKIIKSNGDARIKKIKYSTNYSLFNASNNNWNQSFNALSNINNIVPIEEAIYLQKPNSTNLLLIDATLYEYSNTRLKRIYKLFTKSPLGDFQESYNDANGFYFDNRYKLVQEIVQSDAFNNPLTIQNDSKIESYIRGDNATTIVAVATNAAYADIAYTSFDAGETGNWNFTGAPQVTQSITGVKSYNLSNGAISKMDLNSSKSYIISYWTKNISPISISGTLAGYPITGRTINGWTYFEHKISGQTSITISGSGLIDELRLYPDKSLMTTYTYEPLIGMTSQCDVNNRITYYEYDIFNRLTLIRDQDNNILKKVCYNYAGQPENCLTPCPPNAPANWQNTSTPPTCIQNSCGNTGYQLQEQRDMSTCSSTAGSLRNIEVYNPTACTPGNGVNITFQNIVNVVGYIATYTSLTNGSVYTFNIPSTGTGILGCLPAGRYSLSINKPGVPFLMYMMFGTGCSTQSGTTAYFVKVNVENCNKVILDNDL